MKTSFNTVTLLSTYCWLDNYILQKGQAYINNTSRLYYQSDSRLGTGYVTYAAPFKSFVWDSGVSGAQIINSVSGSIGTMSRGTGMKVDFVNGRVIMDASVGKTAIISGSYAFKELNVYFTNQTQEQMVFSDKYYLNSRFGNELPTGAPPNNWDPRLKAYNMVTPCIFVTIAHTENEPFAFGGTYCTKAAVTLNVLAENSSQLEGVLSLLADAKDVIFPQIETSQWPLNAYGDYKSGYNYQTILQNNCAGNNQYWITDVRTSKVSDYAKIDESIMLGVIDLSIEKVRSIH